MLATIQESNKDMRVAIMGLAANNWERSGVDGGGKEPSGEDRGGVRSGRGGL